MHVGLNCTFLVPGQVGGMEVYARALIPRLAALADTDVTVFVGREAAGEDLGADVRVLPVDASSRPRWVEGEQRFLPRAAARCDVVHSLASTAPLWGPFRRVVTVHDLHYKLVPDAHFGVMGLGMAVLVPAGVRRAHRVLVDAASTREDLAEHLGTDPAKVDVVPLAGGAAGGPASPEADVRARLELGDRPVLLTVSAKRPHKNLLRLVEALAGLPAPRPVLVLPGYPTPHEASLRARAEELGVAGDVRFPAWVSDEDLEGLYGLADAFVFPSLYEGFGLPVLEAMARGVPVATSARASLAEVAGDAALLFDPESVPAITGALERVLADAGLRERLRTAGREQAARFTWEQTARLTRAAYDRA